MNGHDAEKMDPIINEKHEGTKPGLSSKARFLFFGPIFSWIYYLIHIMERLFGMYDSADVDCPTPLGDTTSTLRRMARTQRLVTSLSRLLATKSEVTLQIRERLLGVSRPCTRNRTEKTNDEEVVIYMGDIQGVLPK
jgi:Mg2+ and Co2+ transporter CorA